MNNRRRKKRNTGKIVMAAGIITALLYVYYLGFVKCSAEGCDADRVPGDRYCLYHQYLYEIPDYKKHYHTTGTEKSSGSSSSRTVSSGKSSYSNHGYSDVASDYDNGEDFVDDWGDDFDSDDEAYEYWEDNH